MRRILPLAGLAIATLGASCWAPVPPVAAPVAPLGSAAFVEVQAPLPVEEPRLVLPAVVAAQVSATATPAAAPTASPTPVPPGAAVIAGIRTEYATVWLKNHRQTNFRAGPGDDQPLFNELPQWSTLKQLENRGEWTLVYYGGDGKSRVPGPGWVRTADTGAVGTPTPWLETVQTATLWSSSQQPAAIGVQVPAGVRLEVLGLEGIQGERVHVRTPGDGRFVPPAQGWVDAGATRVYGGLPASQIPWAYPAVLKADVLLPVPYRTQLDGSPYAGANCGPTTVGMVLERFGIQADLKSIRSKVLVAQDGMPEDDDAGSFIWALAEVTRAYGLKTYGLYDADGQTLRQWSVEDVRNEVRNGNPVIAQVRYRHLPRREDSEYYGDHYVVITGLVGDGFVYSDPIWGTGEKEGPGWYRVMTAAELRRAMNASDRPFAYTAFAVGR